MGNRRFGNPGAVGNRSGVLALVDQVRREQRGGVFLDPLIVIVLFYQIGFVMQALWKTVKKQENVMDCFSACAGDYEDPERSAWLDVQ